MSEHSTILSQTPTTAPAAAKNVMPVQVQIQNVLEIQPLQKTSIQFKLAIGTSDDPLEHEADAMADTIMRMPEQNFIQRKCNQCEEEKVQRKPLASFIQRKESSAGTIASDAVSSQINASKGSGNNIDVNTQSFMQSRFGTDFSDVKIHTGGEAIQMNRELNAKAFTVGNDIYFNEGQYNPGSGEGKHLLAHELTHTMQQSGGVYLQRTYDEDGHDILFPAMGSSSEELENFGAFIMETIGYENIITKGFEGGFLTHDHSGTGNPDIKIQRQTFAEAFTPFAYAAGVSALADSPVPGPGDLLAIGILAVGLVAAGIIVATSKTTRVCPPCPAPPPIEIDRVPPSTPHFPCPGDHWHYYQYNQNPSTCVCYGPRRMFGGCCGLPGTC